MSFDILVRYGGDEFLVVGFFISIGYARHTNGMTPDVLVELADSELYREKRRAKAER